MSDIVLGAGNEPRPLWSSQSDGEDEQIKFCLGLPRTSTVLKTQARPCESRELNLGESGSPPRSDIGFLV